ncbi:hypothetical protein EDB83DRAFT_1629167 [Lactarius deliciosus]|nr:hypothetical protein EDB83DRAFT_1629167 [Lactarius deliciosus]
MGDQYPSPPLLEVPGDLLVRVEDHSVPSTARSEVPHSWGPCLPDSPWWQYVAQVYGQDTPFVVSDATSLRSVWPESVNELTARSPILSQSRIPEKPPPLTFPPGNFNGGFGNQAGAIPEWRTRAEYNQHIALQEEQIQLIQCRPLEQGTDYIDSPSTPGSNAQLRFPRNANIFSSDVCHGQIPQQHSEGLKAVQQNLDPDSTRDSENRSKAPHHCTNCSKAYRRHQDLKRHTRDKHEWQRECPFFHTRWSRPERIRTHLMKKHESRLNKEQRQEIRLLRGRDNTIHFLEKYRKTTPPGNYMPD